MEATKKERKPRVYENAPSKANMPINPDDRVSFVAAWLGVKLDDFVKSCDAVNFGKWEGKSPRVKKMQIASLLFSSYDSPKYPYCPAFRRHLLSYLQANIPQCAGLKSFDDCLTPARKAYLSDNESPATIKARIAANELRRLHDLEKLKRIEAKFEAK